MKTRTCAVLVLGLNFFLCAGILFCFMKEGGGDLPSYLHYRTYLRDGLLSGGVPRWMPQLYFGIPFVATPSTGVFYPPTWLFTILPLNIAWIVDFSMHQTLTIAGFVVWGRTLGLSSRASAACGIVGGWGGWFPFLATSGLLDAWESSAWVPWALAALERVATAGDSRERLGRSAAAALPLACIVLPGRPETPLYFMIFASIYFPVRIWTQRLPIRRFLVGAVLTSLLAALLCAPYLIAVGDHLPGTFRNLNELGIPKSGRSMSRSLIDLVFPHGGRKIALYLFGAQAGSAGQPSSWIGVCAVALALRSRFHPDRRIIPAFLLPVLVAIVLAEGESGLAGNIISRIPGLDSLRYPYRVTSFVPFFLAPVIGMGLDSSPCVGTRSSWPAHAVFCFSGALAVWASATALRGDWQFPGFLGWTAFAFLMLGGAFSNLGPRASLAMLVVELLTLGLAGIVCQPADSASSRPGHHIELPAEFRRQESRVFALPYDYRLFDQGICDVAGFGRPVAAAASHPDWHTRLARAGWKDSDAMSKVLGDIPADALLFPSNRIPRRLPLSFESESREVAPGLIAVFRREPIGRLSVHPKSAGECRFRSIGPDVIKIDASTRSACEIRIHDSADRNWVAEVDGQVTEWNESMASPNSPSRALSVSAGDHAIKWTYRPPWAGWPGLLPLIGAALICLLKLRDRRRFPP